MPQERRSAPIIIGIAVAIIATVAPFAALMFVPAASPVQLIIFASILNATGWLWLAVQLVTASRIRSAIIEAAERITVDTRRLPLERLVQRVLGAMLRKDMALSMSVIEKRLVSKQDLSRALERVVNLAHKLLRAESAEIALFDRDSGLYHSSFVLGKPFRKSAQAMLSGALDGESDHEDPGVIVQPIIFAGSVLGTLRVALPHSTLPTPNDRQVTTLLALQAGFAIINTQFTHELLRMKQVSADSVRAKTGFLANLSHELRGPLGIILNAVELVLDGLCGPINGDQLDTLKMVHVNGEHLLELINDVLDYAKAESGRVKPQPVEIPIDELLKDVTNVVRAQADLKRHKVTYQESSANLGVLCDRRHLRQMLINLLTNAIKYTPEGGTIDVWADRLPGGKIKLSVRDTGVGIDESDRSKVFAPFERVENSYSLKQEGTGLGMPLTRKLAEVNQGSIDFTSIVGKGSHFWLVLPASDISATHKTDQEVFLPDAEGRGDVLLLVGRDDGERAMLTRYLGHIGFKVIAVSNAMNACEIVRDSAPALAIIDNTSIDQPGDNLVGSLRERMEGRRLPIILITSRAFIFDIERYLKGGIDRCLIKPIELKELGRIARAIIDGKDSGAVVDESEITKKSSAEKKAALVTTKVIRVDDLMH